MIDFIDVDTLSLSLVVITLFMGVVLIYLGREWKDTIQGVSGIGVSLILVAGTLAADIVFHVAGFANSPSTIASIILIFAFYNMYKSVSLFRKRSIKQWHHTIGLITGVTTIFFLGYIADYHTIRIIIFSSLLIYYATATGIIFIIKTYPSNKSGYIHMGIFFFLFAGLNIYRIINLIISYDVLYTNQGTFSRVVYLIITMLVILLACISFILLVNKELSALKEQLISIMAHDLKNPLATIMSYSDILKRDDFQSKEEQLTFMTLIHDAAGNSLDMINNMMEWTKLNFGKTLIQSRNINIAHLINDLKQIYIPSAELKKININTSIGALCVVHSDPILINTVLRNLLSNAIKYSPENDEITIACEKKDKTIQIDFYNNGPQIEDQLITDILNRKIIQGNIKKGKEGSGLGLFLCAKYLDMLEGKLIAENLPIGCKFSIILPVKEINSQDMIV